MPAVISQFLTILLSIGLGLLLLAAGRRYYPIFVGVGGVTVVLSFFRLFAPEQSEFWVWLIGLAVGASGAFLAPRFEKYSLRIAGFILGGYLAIFLLISNGYFESRLWSDLLVFVAGGGLALWGIHYNRNEWIIVLSSLAGAALVTAVFAFAPALRAALFSGLAAVGMLIQAREWILPAGPVHALSPSNGSNDAV